MHDHGSPHAAGVLGRAGGRLLRNRLLVRAPLRVYQARLGFLFGSRLRAFHPILENTLGTAVDDRAATLPLNALPVVALHLHRARS